MVQVALHELNIYRLITAYLLLQVNLDKIMHARWDFDASSVGVQISGNFAPGYPGLEYLLCFQN